MDRKKSNVSYLFGTYLLQIQQSALAAAAVASASQEPLEEDGVTAATPGGHNSKPSHDGPYHRTPPARPDETSPSSMKPPSRRPYVNTDAIDAHQVLILKSVLRGNVCTKTGSDVLPIPTMTAFLH